MLNNLLEHELDLEILDIQPVSGGDINRAYQLFTPDRKLFLKTNNRDAGNHMLKTEYHALQHLYSLSTSFAPEPVHFFEFEQTPCLIMEFIPSHRDRNKQVHQEHLAQVLLSLHTHKADEFGWKEDNFIGALPQYNNTERKNLTWGEFYWSFRIRPQLELAIDKEYFTDDVLKMKSKLIETIQSFYRTEPTPTLTHGDLWSGNYLIDENSQARLIDPALCYSHPDMDIAMSKLFGGFSNEFYKKYKSGCSIELASTSGHEDIYQLYFLLVHLNLFGTGYLTQCKNILHKYKLI